MSTPLLLWQITAIELDETFFVSGTLLKSDKDSQGARSTVVGNFLDIFSSYFRHPASDKKLRFEASGFSETTITNEKGFFGLELPRFKPDELKISCGTEKLAISQDFPWYFKQGDRAVEVISDIDDTAMISHTASALKRVYTILFKNFRQRRAVEYSRSILQQAASEGYRITYLSKSESNLFNLITAIFRRQELPEGGLLLTPYLRLKQLPKPQKGKDYKLTHLKRLISSQQDKKFILLGDDTQRDMEIYAQVVELYEDRILKIFIRQTVVTRSERQEELWNKLQNTGVNCTYFSDADSVDEELAYLSKIPAS